MIRDSEARKASYFFAKTHTRKVNNLDHKPHASYLLVLLTTLVLKLTQLLDHFLVLVELLKGLDVHVWQFSDLGFITMLLVSKNAD